MIKLKLKLSDDTVKKVNIKSSWDEVTFKEFLDIETDTKSISAIRLFSVLSNIDYELLANSKYDKLLEQLATVTQFYYQHEDWDKMPPPETLTIYGEEHTLPQNLEKLTLGQRVLLSQLYRDGNLHTTMNKAVAIMMFEKVHGKYTAESQSKMEALETEIMGCKALEVYGAGQFFFLNSPLLLEIGRTFLQKSQV
jgi:hypothetical protein